MSSASLLVRPAGKRKSNVGCGMLYVSVILSENQSLFSSFGSVRPKKRQSTMRRESMLCCTAP